MRRHSILGLGFILVAAACGGGSVGGGGDSDDTDMDPDRPDADPFAPDADIAVSRPDADPLAPDAAAEPPLDFENNLLPSPMPPGDLDPKDAPMIIVFGWDDIAFTGDHQGEGGETDNGMNFIAKTFGSLQNPDGSKGSITFYENGAYLPNGETGGPWGSETNLMLAAGQELLSKGFEVGNHTFDHLEINGTWGKIPPQYKTGSLGGWAESVGRVMDLATWRDLVIKFNDQLLVQTYGLSGKLSGFRAPRLEINDDGLLALAEYGYLYDTNMEEGNQWEHVAVATTAAAAQNGFKWVVWPHTLDHGSPGVWQSQDFGEKDYLTDWPEGLWEIPVYMVYLPPELHTVIAQRMKTEITTEDTSWIGDKVREITAFDFNTFLYARMRKDEWVKTMKHTFLTRYNGNRAPLTFGAHPEQFSRRYDLEVLSQANNVDFADVLNYNKYSDRKAAVKEFVDWAKATYPNEVYFMNGKQLVEYMKNPFDKAGNPVQPDQLASPTTYDFFNKFGTWAVNKDPYGSDASVVIEDHNTMTVSFKIGTKNDAAAEYPYVDVATYFEAGAFAGVSHIDIVYETEQPVRVRLLTEESGPLSMQVLLAGVGGERKVRIRSKDFLPDPYSPPERIAAAGFVDAAYLAKVVGLSFESACVKDKLDFDLKIKRIDVHGLSASGKPVVRAKPLRIDRGQRPKKPAGSSIWPPHKESSFGHVH